MSFMDKVDARQLWADLSASHLVSGEYSESTTVADPWYIKVLMGFGGWFGALFLLGFISEGFEWVMDEEIVAAILGVAICAGARLGFQNAENPFMNQFSLAWSFAGQFLVVFGVWDLFSNGEEVAAIIMVGFYAALFYFIDDTLHRIIAAIGVATFAAYLMVEMNLVALIPGVLMAIALTAFFNEFSSASQDQTKRTVGYGFMLVALVTIAMPFEYWDEVFDTRSYTQVIMGLPLRYWLGAVLNATVFVTASMFLLKRNNISISDASGRVLMVAVAVVALFSLKASGLPLTLALLLVGFSQSNRVVMGVGALATLGYMSEYYYLMQISLLEKSYLLMISGVTIFLVRVVLLKVFTNKEVSHA